MRLDPNGTSCDIDAAGVEGACAAVLNGLATSDLVVLASSADSETKRAGLTSSFSEAAITAGICVLTTVSDRHYDASAGSCAQRDLAASGRGGDTCVVGELFGR